MGGGFLISWRGKSISQVKIVHLLRVVQKIPKYFIIARKCNLKLISVIHGVNVTHEHSLLFLTKSSIRNSRYKVCLFQHLVVLAKNFCANKTWVSAPSPLTWGSWTDHPGAFSIYMFLLSGTKILFCAMLHDLAFVLCIYLWDMVKFDESCQEWDVLTHSIFQTLQILQVPPVKWQSTLSNTFLKYFFITNRCSKNVPDRWQWSEGRDRSGCGSNSVWLWLTLSENQAVTGCSTALCFDTNNVLILQSICKL